MSSTSIVWYLCKTRTIEQQVVDEVLSGVTSLLAQKHTRSAANAEIARDADDVDFSVDYVHSALTLVFNSFNGVIIFKLFHFVWIK